MFNRKSDYALNKKEQSSIVYKDAYDNIIQLTVDDFSSEKEFRKWKNWINMKAHTEEKKDHVYRNHTVSLDGFEEFLGPSSGANTYCDQDEADQLIMAQIESQVLQIRAALSEKQFRRVWMYFADGMTMDEIGEKEGISHQNVSKSIDAAMKKIQIIFPKAQKQGAKTQQNRR